MKINKVSDISSHSVFRPPPPSSRRSVLSSSLPEMSSIFRHSQSQSQSGSQSQQQQRSQQWSQQSFSQGISSQQNAGFSQFSQNSQDETLTNDQSILSQERENSVKRFPGLPPVNRTREESQMAISRYSNGLIPKWGSGVSEQKCQMSEKVQQRIGTMESSVSRFGLLLESLQTDVIQVNRGTKELAIDMESIRQKLIANDNFLQTINKGHEDVKSTLNGELKSISEKLNQDTCHLNSKEISILLSTLEEKIRVFVLDIRNDLLKSFTNEMQALGCKLKALEQKNATPTTLPPQAVNYGASLVEVTAQKNSALQPKVQPGTQIPNVERTQIPKERELGVVIDCDKDVDGGFAFFNEENERGRYLAEKAMEETASILRKARRRKRKYNNPIVIIN